MHRALPLLLAAAAALGACKPAAQAPQPAATPSATGTPMTVVFDKGWPQFWADPVNAVDVLNRTGARMGSYAAKGAGYAAEAVPTALDFKTTPKPNTAYITAIGTKGQLDALRYRLDLPQPDQAAKAATSLGEMIVNSFRVLGLAGAHEVAGALNAGKDLTGKAEGAVYSVVRQPAPELGAGAQRIIVTFSRPGASAPANS